MDMAELVKANEAMQIIRRLLQIMLNVIARAQEKESV